MSSMRVLCLAVPVTLLAPGLSRAGYEDVVPTDTGSPLKVVVRNDSAVYEGPEKVGDSRPVEIFQFFYVIKPEENSKEKTKNDFYRLASAPGFEHEVGWIHKDDVVEWPHRQALGLRPIAGRQPALFYRDDNGLKQAYESGTAPTPMSREPEGGTTDINLVPILESFAMKADSDEVNGYRVAYLHSRSGKRGSSTTKGESVDLAKSTLDVVFVIDTTQSMQPHIEATKQAVARIADKLAKETTKAQVRFGLVAYRDVIKSPNADWYVTKLFSDLEQGRNHDQFQSIIRNVQEANISSEDILEDVLAGLKVAIQKAKWNPNAFKHIILLGDAGAQTEMTGPKNFEKLTIDGVLAMAQPRGRETVKEKITIHAVHCYEARKDDQAEEHFQKIAAGDEYPGLYKAFNTAGTPDFIEELVLKVQGALEHVTTTGSTKGLAPDTPGLGLLVEMVEAAEGITGDVPSFASGYCCEIDKEGNQVFEPFVLVQYGRLDMFNSFVGFSVKALRNAGEPGSRDVKKVVQSVQILCTAMSLGEPVTEDISVSRLADLILGFPVRSKIFDVSFAKLAAMSEADFESWVGQIDASKTIIQGHLDNTRIWRSLGPDVALEHRHCFLKVTDLP